MDFCKVKAFSLEGRKGRDDSGLSLNLRNKCSISLAQKGASFYCRNSSAL